MPDSLPVALVTGSTSGIGAAIARRLSREGYAVVLHSRQSAEAGRALAAELGSALYVQADLAVDADRVRLVREAVAAWGRLDVLVNNAGISRRHAPVWAGGTPGTPGTPRRMLREYCAASWVARARSV